MACKQETRIIKDPSNTFSYLVQYKASTPERWYTYARCHSLSSAEERQYMFIKNREEVK